VGGGAIWTLNQGDGTVSRIDVKTRKLVTNIEVGRARAAAARSPTARASCG
jgi:YVTN family beta-propeller protein